MLLKWLIWVLQLIPTCASTNISIKAHQRVALICRCFKRKQVSCQSTNLSFLLAVLFNLFCIYFCCWSYYYYYYYDFLNFFSLAVIRLRRYDRISIGNQHFWRWWSLSAKFSGRRRRPPATIFARIDIGQWNEWMPFNFVAVSFHKEKLCSRLSSRHLTAIVCFWTPFGGTQATYAVHHKLIGQKHNTVTGW